MAITQAQIDALIQFIDETEVSESVTNVIVAAILSFLNEKVKDIEDTRATTEELETESEERSEADSALQQGIDTLTTRITALVGSMANKTDKNSTTQRLEYSQSSPVVLKSMGQELDGHLVALGPGNLFFNPSDNKIYRKGSPVTDDVVIGSGQGYPDQSLIYCNAETGKLYRWTGSAWEELVSTGTMGSEEFEVIKTAFTTLMNSLANSAFSTGRPTIIWDVPETFSVTRTLSHCTSSNTGNTATEGNPYSTTLTAAEGYSLRASGASVVVTMGGINVTSSAYNASTGVISIASVNGNIVITATAVEVSSHTITYNLSGVTKVSGATEVEDGGSLSAVLRKDDDFAGKHVNDSVATTVAFGGNDVIVMMNGQVVQGAISQQSLNADVSVNIDSVIGDVTVFNILWIIGTINASNGTTTNSSRSICPTGQIPLPDGCEELTIRHNYLNSNGQTQNYGVAFYDSSGTYISGVGYNTSIVESVAVPSGAKYFKCSVYNYKHDGNAPTQAFIKDETNNKYIWKGDNVE